MRWHASRTRTLNLKSIKVKIKKWFTRSVCISSSGCSLESTKEAQV